MKLSIYPEMCCEECRETIHNHFDCPSCNTLRAPTDVYMSVYELDVGDEIECEVCESQFILISKDEEVINWGYQCGQI